VRNTAQLGTLFRNCSAICFKCSLVLLSSVRLSVFTADTVHYNIFSSTSIPFPPRETAPKQHEGLYCWADHGLDGLSRSQEELTDALGNCCSCCNGCCPCLSSVGHALYASYCLLPCWDSSDSCKWHVTQQLSNAEKIVCIIMKVHILTRIIDQEEYQG